MAAYGKTDLGPTAAFDNFMRHCLKLQHPPGGASLFQGVGVTEKRFTRRAMRPTPLGDQHFETFHSTEMSRLDHADLALT